MERTIEPTPERFGAFTGGPDEDGPLVMLNLLRFREQAAYPKGFEAAPATGREAYARYGAVALEQVGAVGGRVLWSGSVRAAVIAPPDEEWDEVLLVEYPSRAAFLEMLGRPAYQAAIPHRSAALLDSRLVATDARADAAGARM